MSKLNSDSISYSLLPTQMKKKKTFKKVDISLSSH